MKCLTLPSTNIYIYINHLIMLLPEPQLQQGATCLAAVGLFPDGLAVNETSASLRN